MANNDGRRVEAELDCAALGCGQSRGRFSRPLYGMLIHRRVRVLHDELAEATHLLPPAVAIPPDLLHRINGVQVDRTLREPIGHREDVQGRKNVGLAFAGNAVDRDHADIVAADDGVLARRNFLACDEQIEIRACLR